MKERPIIFSGAMVKAILDGRKTQTRRLCKCAMFDGEDYRDNDGWPFTFDEGTGDDLRIACPYGVPGDRLWVREQCRAHELTDVEAHEDTYGIMERGGLEMPPYGLDGVIYSADGVFREIQNTREAGEAWGALNAYRGAKGAVVPSIHMPRWASRITLEIVDVRVQRLQEISAKDILAEGAVDRAHDDQFGHNPVSAFDGKVYMDLRSLWAKGWDSINAKRAPWSSNPWVWAITFLRLP